jgi:hypothetical protein
MAHLFRLILAALALFVSVPSSAAIPMGYGYFGSTGPTTHVSSCSAAVERMVVAMGEASPWNTYKGGDCLTWTPRQDSAGEYSIVVFTETAKGSTSGGNFNAIVYRVPGTVCPANSSAGTGGCVCNTGYAESGGACAISGGPGQPGGLPDEKQAEKFCAGMGNGGGWKQVGVSSGSTPSESCYMPSPPFDGADANKGCVTKLGDSVAVPNADGTRSWSAYGAATGAVCSEPPKISDGTSNQNPPPRAAENPCPKGYPGTVNGAAVCVPVASTNGVDSTVKTASTNADGSKAEVIEETKCAGGICTTTTTTNNYNSAGVSTGTTRTSATESIASKCTKSPTNKVCTETGTGGGGGSGSGSGSGSSGGEGGESSFGGTCANGFKAVSDDAVINAMAEETFRQNCKVNPDTESQKEGKAAYEANAEPGNMTKDNPNNSEVSVGPERFDTSNAIGGGGCIADKTVTVAGKSIMLPLSNVCQYLSVLGSVLMACSFLLAARIVTRG